MSLTVQQVATNNSNTQYYA